MSSASEPDLVTRAVRRWLPVTLLLGVVVVLVRLASQPLTNPDTFFHLRFGAEFLDGWSLRDPGSVSSFATADWVPTQWLPEVVMAQLERSVGLGGVAWFSGLQLLLLAAALYWAARGRADLLVTSIVVIAALVASSSGLSARPQVISFALIVVTSSAWLSARQSGRPPWLLVPLTWIWVTYHGMWPVGIAIGTVAAVCIVVDRREFRRWWRWLAVPVLSLVVSCLTPVGAAIWPAVTTVGERRHYFSEWAVPQLVSSMGVGVGFLLLSVVLVWARRGGVDLTRGALLVLAAGMTVASNRTVPLAAAVLTPLAAEALQSLIGAPRLRTRREAVIGGGVVVAALIVLAVVLRSLGSPAPTQPGWVAPSLGRMPAGTKVLDDWSWGGYLMWAYPQLDLMMHGYGDTFTDEELRRNTDILSLKPGWDDLVREAGAEYAVVDPASALDYALRGEGWTVLDHSEDIDLLRAPAGWSVGESEDSTSTP